MADEPTNGNGFGVKITNRELYDSIRALENKVADSLRTQDSMLKEIAEHSKRLRGLELRFYGILAGLVGAVAVLIRAGVPL